MQGLYSPRSSLHLNVAPGSELNETATLAAFFLVLILPLGRFVIFRSGGVVSGGSEESTAKGWVAGESSTFNAGSMARTAKV